MVWQHLFGTKAAFAGGSLVAIAGRRALWPAFFIGSAFSGAAWFGSFELVWSASKFAMPIPDQPDSSAQATGLMTLPLTTGGTVWLGWRGTPSLAPLHPWPRLAAKNEVSVTLFHVISPIVFFHYCNGSFHDYLKSFNLTIIYSIFA